MSHDLLVQMALKSFQFNGKHYLQTLGTAMGTSTTILSRTVFKPRVWKRYIDDIFSLWDINKLLKNYV